MIFQLELNKVQTALRDLKTVASKSPLAAKDDASDLGVLITADDKDNKIKLEVAIKGFHLSTTVSCEVREAGSLIARVDSITNLNYAGDCIFSSTDKVLKIKGGKSFKVDVPSHNDVEEITVQRPVVLNSTHSIHSNKLQSALKCVSLESKTKDPLFAKFVFGPSGFSVWSNNPSTAALYQNNKSAFDENLEVVLPVDFLSAYLSKVGGKVQLAVDETQFQLVTDEIELSHPLKDSDVLDIQTMIKEIIDDKEYIATFGCLLPENIDVFDSVSSFTKDNRMVVAVDPKKSTLTCSASSESGEGENSFTLSDVSGSATKLVEFPLNCKVITKLLETVKSITNGDIVWYLLKDRVVVQSSDGSVTFLCAHSD